MLVVLILLSLMLTLIVSNAVILRRLKVELRLLEQKQTNAWAQSHGAPKPAQPNPPGR
jgi:hypothetical protein